MKSGIQGLLSAGVMSAGLIAADSISKMEGVEDDLEWLSDLLKKG